VNNNSSLVGRLSILLVLMSVSGCLHRWGDHWVRLPSRWRTESADVQPQSNSLFVLETGARGFRFASAAGWIEGRIDSADSLPDGVLVKVHWGADPDAVKGVVLRSGGIIRFWLSSDRIALRMASELPLYLLDDHGERVFDLPLIKIAYQLDTDRWDLNSVSGYDGRCVAAEAAILANSEIRLIRRDEQEGRLNHDDASDLQNKLAPLLASSVALCKRDR
jgi:hypothetical protein